MATFSDTPKWKKRQAYEQTKAITPPSWKQTPLAVSCPTCAARPGQPCTSKPAKGSRPIPPHQRRIQKGSRYRKMQKQMAASQEQRWGGVTVRYECPICGGDHSRADHPSATGNASVFDVTSMGLGKSRPARYTESVKIGPAPLERPGPGPRKENPVRSAPQNSDTGGISRVARPSVDAAVPEAA